MATFECRWPSNECEWHAVEAIDPIDAAERHAAAICRDDNGCYSAFEKEGEEIEARLAGSNVVVTYCVTVEFDPTFRARRVEGG